MTKIKLDEISAVTYPAHLVNGFAVIKSATDQDSSAILDALSKRNSDPMTTDLTKAVAEASIEDLQKALEERTDVADVVKAFAPKVDPEKAAAKDEEDDITKGLDPKVAEILKAQADKIEEFRKAAEKSATDAAVEKSLRLDREAIEKAKADYTNLAYDHDTVDPLIRKFVDANPDAGEALETMLKAVNAQADGAIFKELGTKATPTDADPLANIAKALVADGKATNYADAIAKAVADPANKALVSAHFEAGSN